MSRVGRGAFCCGSSGRSSPTTSCCFPPTPSSAGSFSERSVWTASVGTPRACGSPLSTTSAVPALLSGLMLLVWFPLIARKAPATFENASARSADPYLGRWLLLTAALFAGSALLLVARARRMRGSSLPTSRP